MYRVFGLCVILFDNAHAGQANKLLSSSLYQNCVNMLAKSGTDNSAMPDAIQRDIYHLQVEQDTEVYNAYRQYALEQEAFDLSEGFSEPTQEGITFAYKHFPHADISYTTECARGYISIPTAVTFLFTLQGVCCVSSLACMSLFPPLLTKIAIAAASCSASGVLLETSFRCCLRKTCLEAAFPHPDSFRRECFELAFPRPNQPQPRRMDLDLPDHSEIHQTALYDEDITQTDAICNDRIPLLEE